MGRKKNKPFAFNLYSVLVPTLLTLTPLTLPSLTFHLSSREIVSYLEWHLHKTMRPIHIQYIFKKG